MSRLILITFTFAVKIFTFVLYSYLDEPADESCIFPQDHAITCEPTAVHRDLVKTIELSLQKIPLGSARINLQQVLGLVWLMLAADQSKTISRYK